MPAAARERILELARRQPRTSLTDLARTAGVSRATLHRYFPSRRDLLRELDLNPEPEARQRALQAAVELLARDGLAQLSMECVAKRAGISRAQVYRLFSGKAALFKELVCTYSPLEPIGATIASLGNEPPEVVMPALALAAAHHLEGRLGLVRSLLFEVSAPSEEAATARELVIHTAILPVTAYLQAQMRAGRLRRMSPLLALQAFVGPLIAHVILRPFARDLSSDGTTIEAAVVELANVWLAAMRPLEEADQ